MKKCKICCLDVNLEEFARDKYTKDEFKAICKSCERAKRYIKAGKDIPEKIIFFKDGLKRCAKCEEYKETELFYLDKNKCYSSYCISCSLIKNKESYNPEYTKAHSKKYYLENKEQLNTYSREYGLRNKDKISKNKNNYYINNKEILRVKKRETYRKRYSSDPLFRLKENFRNGILKVMKGRTKSKSTLEILGCSLKEFKNHIESQFLPWMTWDNYGLYNGELNYGWDLDHILPISSAGTEVEVYTLNNWLNFQPLCSKVNRDIKKDKIYGGF
jgi:hypothetical protein